MRFAIAGIEVLTSVAVLHAQIKNLPDAAPSLLPVDVHDQVDAAPDIRLDRIHIQAIASAHHQSCKTMDGFLGAAGVDGSKRTAMSGIHGIQKSPCLRAAHFAHNDAVGPMAENGLEQIIERDLTAVRVRL